MSNTQHLSSHAQPRYQCGYECGSAWETPRVEVISLSCEITAYAPDGEPLF